MRGITTLPMLGSFIALPSDHRPPIARSFFRIALDFYATVSYPRATYLS